MLEIVITAGLAGFPSFVAGWIFAELANGRTNFRARYDAQERRHQREVARWKAAADEQRDEPEQDRITVGSEVRRG